MNNTWPTRSAAGSAAIASTGLPRTRSSNGASNLTVRRLVLRKLTARCPAERARESTEPGKEGEIDDPGDQRPRREHDPPRRQAPHAFAQHAVRPHVAARAVGLRRNVDAQSPQKKEQRNAEVDDDEHDRPIVDQNPLMARPPRLPSAASRARRTHACDTEATPMTQMPMKTSIRTSVTMPIDMSPRLVQAPALAATPSPCR